MIRKLFAILIIAFSPFYLSPVLASQTSTNWGENILGIQLSISVTNRFMDVGPATICATIKNGSTNAIGLVETGPFTDFDVFLTNNTGQSLKLTPDRRLMNFRTSDELKAGESRNWTILIIINKGVDPGEYSLKATRRFTVNSDWYEMVSNALIVQIN